LTKDQDVKPRAEAQPLAGRLVAVAKQAARALVVERAWPPLVFAATVLVLFAAVSWAGAWQFAPRVVRVAGVALAGVAVLAALAPLIRLRWPSRRDVADRLDRDSGVSYRPAASLDDSLANNDDPMARALWEAHRARLARELETVRVSPPSPRMAERDPYAIRFAAVILAFAAAVLAGPELYGRFASAFDWRSGEAVAGAAGARIDAWIDPPPYAGRPPIVVDFKSAEPQKLAVFEDSVLVVRGDPAVVETRVEGALKPADPKASAEPRAERRWTISGDGQATILREGAKAAGLVFAVTPAGVPRIALTEVPGSNLSGTLTLSYKIEDRYGIAGARAEFALPHDPSTPAPRTLAEPPQTALQVPATINGAGEARTTADLSESPWAGARVLMTLSAVSISGRTGVSAPVEVSLPEHPFHNPLARALVEQRRNLILDPDHAVKGVSTALDGLTIAPELFDTPAPAYLGMNQAKTLLGSARSDADLLDVAGLLWAIAQSLENGDATAAERDLRAAEQALRDALKQGASDQEIKKLMDKLREAANRFANEMARDAQQSPEDSTQQTQDLDQMMDRMEEAARSGSREEAQAMLDQLQDMFENMRSAEDQESPEEKALQKQIGELEKLLRDQQALRDDTYKSDQRDLSKQRQKDGNDEAGPQPGQSESGQDKSGDKSDSAQGDDRLGQRQQALRDRLAELQKMLKSFGMKGEKGFDDAQKHMKDAEQNLKGGQQPGEGDGGQSGKGAAVDAQGRALQALREGAQGLQKQMSQGEGQGQGQGRGKGHVARRGRPGQRPGDDPLGRGREGNMGREDGMLRGAEGRAERARRVVEELRRRLADPSRPIEERDYLERLMKRD
jgi:uncharacterized protein (TIGR02302 family)